MAAVCKAWFEASRAAEQMWLATVVAVEGSTYRRPGARLLFSRDAILAGAISGGCLERELARTGPWLTRNGPVIKVFDSRWDDDEVRGTGCDGKVHVLLEPITAVTDGALAVIGRELDAERSVALVTLLASQLPNVPLGARVLKTDHGLVSQVPDLALARRCAEVATEALLDRELEPVQLDLGGATVLLEVLEPAPHLFVFGAGADAVPVVHLASLLGWNVTVCGARSHVATRARFAMLARVSEQSPAEDAAALDRCARPLAVVMSHDYEADRDVLQALLGTRVPYIGMLGPARRTERMFAELEQAGTPPPADGRQRVWSPAGLALGAETAEEIALSILAEAQAVLAASEPGFLRERSGSIHRRPEPDAPATFLRLVESP
jgi:xanthine/CO dehydrogenase XdhC/CoxF family maturation factor